MEDFFDFSSFKSDGLKVSFVVVVEERQGLSRVCGGTEVVVSEERQREMVDMYTSDKKISCICRLFGFCY